MGPAKRISTAMAKAGTRQIVRKISHQPRPMIDTAPPVGLQVVEGVTVPTGSPPLTTSLNFRVTLKIIEEATFIFLRVLST